MVLESETIITKAKNSGTHYISIPSHVARDSQFPFKAGEKVKIKVMPEEKKIIIYRA